MAADDEEVWLRVEDLLKDTDFGISELKIDVKSGLAKYVKLLVDSPLKVRTTILMGSRARGLENSAEMKGHQNKICSVKIQRFERF